MCSPRATAEIHSWTSVTKAPRKRSLWSRVILLPRREVGAHRGELLVGQAHGAPLGDRLAADVVAELAVDEDLVVDPHARGAGEDEHERVLQVREAQRGLLGSVDPGRDELLAEQPAHRVDLVDRGVVDRHVPGVVLGDRRVAVGAVDHERLAERTGVEQVLHLAVAGVEAAHEADRDQATAGGLLGLHDPQRGGGRGGQRLLAAAPACRRRCRPARRPRGPGRSCRSSRRRPRGLSMSSAEVAKETPPIRSATSAARAGSTSLTATTRPPAITVWMRSMCACPMPPGPIIPMRTVTAVPFRPCRDRARRGTRGS